MKYTKPFLFTLIICFLFGCKPSGEPSDALKMAAEALNSQDSAALTRTFSTELKQKFDANPIAIRDALDSLKCSHIDLKILGTEHDSTGKPLAVVLFKIHITGKLQESSDSMYIMTVKEDDGWKLGKFVHRVVP